ncbi:MAG: adenosylmethionine decarboxylase [Candidatus Aenigmarchaeota archaeon]|nr:adenosylmethionine decarboxylase [Candidatus Aenigmarchaeota archaeon]
MEFIDCSNNILNNKKAIEKAIETGIKNCGLYLVKMNSHQFNPVGITTIAIISESHIAIHTYPEASHASVDLFTCSSNPKTAFKILHSLEERIKPRAIRILAVARGNPLEIRHPKRITNFSITGVETTFHIRKRLFTKKSKYQHIDVIENDNFGKMLFLDNDLQIAENDVHIYDTNIISPLVTSNNKLKNVLVLGGGDGGVALELLRYNPENITVVEIDQDVVSASKRFFPQIAKKAFENPKVKLILDDAYRFLDRGGRFDAIIYDLTNRPESFMKMSREKFLDKLFLGINKNLKKDGMVTLQCCDEFETDTLKMLRRILNKYFKDVTFYKAFIPSYCVNWVFASARPK